MGEDGELCVSVIVTADSEDNQTFTWEEKVTRTCSLKKLAKMWAAAHGVPDTAVGFEDPQGFELDLKKTLIQLSLVGGKDTASVVRLVAFPLDDMYAEAEDKTADVRDVEVPSRKHQKSASNAPVPPVPLPPPATEPPVEAKVKPEKRERDEEAVDRPAAKAAKKPDRPASADAPEAESAAETTPAKAPPAPKAKVKAAAKESPAKSPAVDPKGKAKAKSSGAEQSKAKPAGTDGPTPRDDDPIEYVQESPKRQGTAAYDRYEKYKKAKTPNEAMALGAVKGDIAHDFKHGYMKRA